VLITEDDGTVHKAVHTFGTMTADLVALEEWLAGWQVTHVALESTGVYWRPVFNLIEDGRTVVLVNAQHMRQVPGRKTDVKLRHEVVQVAVGPVQPGPNRVFCHSYPTVACD
jgi:transposase